jgi:hypothetical protein
MAAYFNYTTFDIIGDLSFGSSFSCLQLETLHPWVKAIFDGAFSFNAVTALRRSTPSFVLKAITTLMPSLLKGIKMQNIYAARKVEERMGLGAERYDFIESMIRTEGDLKKKMEHNEIVQNARLLVIAGSETTATALAGTAYLIAMHEDVQRKLAEEVRGIFKSEDEIEWNVVGKLKYMLAVLDESMRVMPPVPGSFPRVVQEEGGVICGRWVPGGVSYIPRGFEDKSKGGEADSAGRRDSTFGSRLCSAAGETSPTRMSSSLSGGLMGRRVDGSQTTRYKRFSRFQSDRGTALARSKYRAGLGSRRS